MKMINKYLVTLVAAAGMLTACTDGNDWATDSSVSRNYAPTSLEVTFDDDLTPNYKGSQVPATATALEIQVSESPLAEGFDDPSTTPADVLTGIVLKGEETTKGDHLTWPNGKPDYKENTTYYFRSRVVSEDGKAPSKWYTDGVIGGTYAVTTPAVMRADDVNVGEDQIILSLNKDYCKLHAPAYVTIQGEGEELRTQAVDAEATEIVVTDLTPGKAYEFILYTAEDVQIGKCNAKTETTPRMDLALSISEFGAFGSGEAPAEFSAGAFKMILHDNAKMKSEAKTGVHFYNPLKQDWESSHRFNPNSKENSITFEIPAKGRLYIYAQQGAGNIRKMILTQNAEKIKEVVVAESCGANAGQTGKTAAPYFFTKAYVEPGNVEMTYPDGPIYIFGVVFVPDAE